MSSGVTPLSQTPPPPAALVFVRWWAEGPVKTRLAAGIGAEAARAVYRTLAEAAWAGLADPRLARHLWITPPERLAECCAWLPGAARAAAQPEADLGARMSRAFETAFVGGAPWAAAVGSDVLGMDAALVLRAGALLERADLAIAPACDGGYALLALRQAQPELFSDIPWSTPQVLELTLARAARLGLRVGLLPPARDVDTLEDLSFFADRFPDALPSRPA